MLDGDFTTYQSLRALTEIVTEDARPLVLWIGAGASVWCNYPTWKELAEAIHSGFIRRDRRYNKEVGQRLIETEDYPGLFGLCRQSHEQLYFSLLVKELKTRPTTPVYKRFIGDLNLIKPTAILTTNVDELLEHNLRDLTVLQRSDISRAVDLIHKKEGFVVKLHGSLSSIRSTIFTADDYEKLLEEEEYTKLLEYIFTATSVVFFGYGLADQYVLKLLNASDRLKAISGTGPHFAVLSKLGLQLPEFIHRIGYVPEAHSDHRSSLTVLEEVIAAKPASEGGVSIYDFEKSTALRSAHLLSEILPPGSWRTSQTLGLSNGMELINGSGITTAELPITESTALHDLVVGLLCFDVVYVPFRSTSKLHLLLGGDLFWSLIQDEALKLIEWSNILAISYPDPASLSNGELRSCNFTQEDERVRIRERIRASLAAVPGKEAEANKLFEDLERRVEFVDRHREPAVERITQGLLSRPSVRSLIGMSVGTPSTSIPRWMAYPILRLANLVKVGVASQLFGFASTKVDYGAAKLAGPAFAAATGLEWADDMAAYVATGEFGTDLGVFIRQDPNRLKDLIKFRESQSGVSFRKEVLQQLAIGAGSDFAASVNAGLRHSIPTAVLQQAHDHVAGLITPKDPGATLTRTAIWNGARVDEALLLWKKESQRKFSEYSRTKRIYAHDLCPCNSGERVRDCCKISLFDGN